MQVGERSWILALFYMLCLPGKSVILFRSNSSVSHLTAFGCETAAQPCDINLNDSAVTQNCMKGPIWCNRRLTPTTGVPLLSTLFQKLTAQLTNTQEKPTAAGFHTFLTARLVLVGVREGSDPNFFFFKIYQNLICWDFVAIWRGFPSPNQKITKNAIKRHQKSHENHQSPKKWDFFMKKVYA